MELRVDPADGLVGELPQIEVSGAAGGQPVELELGCVHAAVQAARRPALRELPRAGAGVCDDSYQGGGSAGAVTPVASL
ncbi:MAG TPA: hypothetical protein VES62_09020 [Thermoleophilaceae bacterium]|nr:hypothetical protein [Thermoleophilaceae bacterium]